MKANVKAGLFGILFLVLISSFSSACLNWQCSRVCTSQGSATFDNSGDNYYISHAGFTIPTDATLFNKLMRATAVTNDVVGTLWSGCSLLGGRAYKGTEVLLDNYPTMQKCSMMPTCFATFCGSRISASFADTTWLPMPAYTVAASSFPLNPIFTSCSSYFKTHTTCPLWDPDLAGHYLTTYMKFDQTSTAFCNSTFKCGGDCTDGRECPRYGGLASLWDSTIQKSCSSASCICPDGYCTAHSECPSGKICDGTNHCVDPISPAVGPTTPTSATELVDTIFRNTVTAGNAPLSCIDWHWGDGTGHSGGFAFAGVNSHTHTYAAAGTYVISAKVCDNTGGDCGINIAEGGCDIENTTIYVGSTASNPIITAAEAFPNPVGLGEQVLFFTYFEDETRPVNLRGLICSSNSLTGAACSATTICTTPYVYFPVFSWSSCQITAPGGAGLYTYYAFVCDDSGHCSAGFPTEDSRIILNVTPGGGLIHFYPIVNNLYPISAYQYNNTPFYANVTRGLGSDAVGCVGWKWGDETDPETAEAVAVSVEGWQTRNHTYLTTGFKNHYVKACETNQPLSACANWSHTTNCSQSLLSSVEVFGAAPTATPGPTAPPLNVSCGNGVCEWDNGETTSTCCRDCNCHSMNGYVCNTDTNSCERLGVKVRNFGFQMFELNINFLELGIGIVLVVFVLMLLRGKQE